MKQKNLTILSLLTSLMLLVFAGSALADVTVQFVDKTFDVGRVGQTIDMEVTATDALSMFDVVAEIADGGAYATVTGVSFNLLNGSGSSDLSMVDGPTEDVFRLWATNLGGCDPVLDAGTTVAATLTVDIGCTEGVFTITPTGIDWNIDAFTTATTTFVGTDCAAQNVTGELGTFTVEANAPFFTNCPNDDLVFGCNEPANFDFEADDIDLGYCNEELSFAVTSGPGSINAQTGEWTWNSVGEVGVHNVQVSVTDTYGYEDFCDFVVVITNQAPVVDYCPPAYDVPYDGISKVWVCFGEEAFGTVDAHDQDDPVCPGPLQYYLESFDGPGQLTVNAQTGDWSWQTDDEPNYAGIWTVVIGVTDGVAEDDVFCEFEIRVTGMEIKVAKTGEDEFVFQGTYTEVPIYAFVDGQDIGGFEFLLGYDASALTFIEASLGEYLDNADWEYFTFRKGPFSNCGSECPSGLVQLIGINDANNGLHHPTHPDSWFWEDSITVANLKFYVTNDRTYEGQYVPIGFHWLDCNSNSLSDSTGNQLFLSRNVYWFDRPNDQYILLDPDDNPHIAGWQSVPPPMYENCTEIADPNKPFPLGCVDFYFGGIDIADAEEIDLRGDVNLNGRANEIADAVLYTNYFIYGQSVFTVNLQGQIAASDVNNDGKVLTVGDLVYLVRVITNDAVAFSKLTPFANSVDVAMVNGANGLSVKTSSSVDVGAAWFVFDVEANAEVELSADMDVKSDLVDGELHVLVYDIGTRSIPAGENELFNVISDGSVTLSRVDMVDYNGVDLTVNARMKALPKNFAVHPNYPNPFNPETTIALDLPEASNWSIDIYNVNGQIVKSYSGYDNAGRVTVTVDGSGMASGIYFYRGTVGDYSVVHKMVLMK